MLVQVQTPLSSVVIESTSQPQLFDGQKSLDLAEASAIDGLKLHVPTVELNQVFNISTCIFKAIFINYIF